MFMGEAVCGLYYLLFFRRKFLNEESENEKEILNPFMFAIPALTDLAASFMVFFGLT